MAGKQEEREEESIQNKLLKFLGFGGISVFQYHSALSGSEVFTMPSRPSSRASSTRSTSKRRASLAIMPSTSSRLNRDAPKSMSSTKEPGKSLGIGSIRDSEETPVGNIRRSSRKVKAKRYNLEEDFDTSEDKENESDEDFDCELNKTDEPKVFTLKDLKKKRTSEYGDQDYSPKSDEELSPPTDRPKRNRRSELKRSSAARGMTTPKSSAKPSPARTSKRRSSVKRPLIMTPRVPSRSSVTFNSNLSPLQEAQARLHVSAVPESLPCRENEFAEICAFTESKIREHGGGCMYISGVPGTGKTATVKEVIKTLKDQVLYGDMEDFHFVEINGMRLTEPTQAYVQIWKELSQTKEGIKISSTHAHDLLEKRFSGSNRKTTVLLVDELDMLWNRKQSVLYNLFDWPTKKEARLVVLAIANTMDLPEKMMMNRITSRLGLTRLQFAPYSHQQLQEIVACRLTGLTVFDSDAIQLVARKVASLSGDARRALDICRRATEIAQRDSQSHLVGIDHIEKAHEEMFCSPRIMAIRHCSKYEKLFLQAIVEKFRQTGIEESTFEAVYDAFLLLLGAHRLLELNPFESIRLCMSLAASRLILAESGSHGPKLRIWLNVSPEDILFALGLDKKKE